MTEFVKEFITTYQKEIDADKWSELYKYSRWNDHLVEVGNFTETLLDAGIDPLEYLDSIPAFYLYGCTHEHEITVPEQITVIHSFSLCNAACLTKIYLPKTLKSIEAESFTNCSNMVNDELEIIYDGTVADWQKVRVDRKSGLPRFYKVKTTEGWTR